MGVAGTKRNAGVRRPSPRTAGGGGSTGTLFNVVARTLAWYTLYTVLFRCPTVPTNDSPTICHTSHAISNALRPHLEPYYDAYVSPYVTEYGPHVKYANEHYIIPVYRSASSSYEKFAAPHVTRGQEYASKEYNRSVRPRVDEVFKKAIVYYDGYLSPHVATANEFYATAQPYLIRVGKTAEWFSRELLVPAFEQSLERFRHIIVTIVAPLVRANGEKAVGWGIGVWSEVVRPQVGRIGKRFGGTGSGVPAASSISASVFSSFSSTDTVKATASAASLSSIISSASAEAASAKASASSPVTEANEGKTSDNEAERPTKEEIREIIKADLENWKVRLGAATEKAAADLGLRIDEISTGAKNGQEIHVQEEIESLEELIGQEFASLKMVVQELAGPVGSGKGKDHQQTSEAAFVAKSKEAGIKIRDKAQSIRVESQQFLSNVYADVAKAADDHLLVLDSVLDLAMQELGMKWAWMDHVTYKDWQKYHELKKEFDNLRRNVIVAAQRNRKLTEITHWTERNWEGKATDVAKEAADELKRLKTVSKRKIQLSDPSDDFSESVVPAAAHQAAQAIMKEAEDALSAAEKLVGHASEAIGNEPPTTQSAASPASEKAKSAASVASEKKAPTAIPEAMLGEEEPTPVAPSVSSAVSEIKESAKPKVWGGVDAGFVAGSRVEYDVDGGGDEEPVGEKAQSVVDAANSKLAEASRAVSAAIAGASVTQSPGEKYASIASEKYESAISAASSALYVTPQPSGESLVSIATDKYSAAVAAASNVIYGTPTPRAEAFAAEAKSKYAAALAAAEESYSGLLASSASVQSQYDQAVKQAQITYQSVIDAASAKVHGTPQPTVESVVSAAKAKYQEALGEAQKTCDSWYDAASTAVGIPIPPYQSVDYAISKLAENAASAASEKIYGTSQPPIESPTSVVGEHVATATTKAQIEYESVKALISELVHGKEPTYTESVMSRFSSLFHATPTPLLSRAAGGSYSSASSSLDESRDPATSAMGSTMAPPPSLESIISYANAQVQSAISAASEQVYGPTPTQGSVESMTSVVDEGHSSTHSSVSSAIHGRKTIAAFESANARINAVIESAKSAISEVVYGTEKGTVEQATGTISQVLSTVTEAAAAAVSDAQARVSEAAYGPEKGFLESAQRRVEVAVESGRRRLGEVLHGYVAQATEAAGSAYNQATKAVSSVVSSVSSVAVPPEPKTSSATAKVKATYETVREDL
ncbi:hypothetical protein C7212DRAFT_178860 [Tuber magnatum]|uniref:Transcription factor hoxa13 n=1 Tax=Tuber magnatum TaxID=42249 RepID=A0A317SSU1_9PEZI|nr:hypothetical protein C7212DRAFT_178860 [Tuber magnatum]